jgi:DNA-directed RNA polymerase specialized sigma24 family protein
MKSYEQLTVLYRQYRDGRIGRTVFESKILREIAANFAFFVDGRPYEDNAEDFLSWLYIRLHRAIDRYTECGASFDAYIHVFAREAYREYCRKDYDHFITEQTVWAMKAREHVAESACRYPQAEVEEEAEKAAARPFAAVSNPKQILALLLKAYHDVPDDMLARIAPALGMQKETLEMLMVEMRELCAKREERIHDLRERVHAQFYRCISFQYRAAAAPSGSAKQQHYLRSVERGRRRLYNMRRTLRTLHTGASSREIAAVLGVSKGSVDASLHYLREHAGREA